MIGIVCDVSGHRRYSRQSESKIKWKEPWQNLVLAILIEIWRVDDALGGPLDQATFTLIRDNLKTTPSIGSVLFFPFFQIRLPT